jgi:hypothetical protein
VCILPSRRAECHAPRSQYVWTGNWPVESRFRRQVSNGGFELTALLKVRIRANCITTALGRSPALTRFDSAAAALRYSSQPEVRGRCGSWNRRSARGSVRPSPTQSRPGWHAKAVIRPSDYGRAAVSVTVRSKPKPRNSTLLSIFVRRAVDRLGIHGVSNTEADNGTIGKVESVCAAQSRPPSGAADLGSVRRPAQGQPISDEMDSLQGALLSRHYASEAQAQRARDDATAAALLGIGAAITTCV